MVPGCMECPESTTTTTRTLPSRPVRVYAPENN